MNDDNKLRQDKVTTFNLSAVEFRTRVLDFNKQLLLISGGIQTITISAFISGNILKLGITTAVVSHLKYGWICLSISMTASLLLQFGQTVAFFCMVRKHKKLLRSDLKKIVIIEPPSIVIIVMWTIVIIAFLSCLAGIWFISVAAISILHA